MSPSSRIARSLLAQHARTFQSTNHILPRPSSIATRSFTSQPPLSSPRPSLSTLSPPTTHLRQTRSPRTFSTTPHLSHGHLDKPPPGEERHITFIDKDSTRHTFEVADGANLLDIAQANDLEMEGACGGSCACSTCHVIVEDGDMYDKMEEPDDDENDMLDLAFGLTETSRLGCQIKMSKELDGLVVRLPSMTRNLQASDFAKK
ncbi:2Fe-2S ferredoxin-type domain-containing protein [Elsinoe ampelina]|uniref:2Fe-2S ferredoxin-type domain-containing protein n=1 Tax=Elsinoe ampelina TaxID=302913 RepID=A0A6A6G4G4_9PEZI|nr:2Fe-2S ferredoxin-type domain-containing protein [Elsinoe ampelina]